MAVNCSVVPLAIWAVAGVTAIDDRVADVTFRVVLTEIPPHVAVMVVEPTVTGVASPAEPAALLTVATPGLDELHVT